VATVRLCSREPRPQTIFRDSLRIETSVRENAPAGSDTQSAHLVEEGGSLQSASRSRAPR
jgi:hypothetical protein